MQEVRNLISEEYCEHQDGIERRGVVAIGAEILIGDDLTWCLLTVDMLLCIVFWAIVIKYVWSSRVRELILEGSDGEMYVNRQDVLVLLNYLLDDNNSVVYIYPKSNQP